MIEKLIKPHYKVKLISSDNTKIIPVSAFYAKVRMYGHETEAKRRNVMPLMSAILLMQMHRAFMKAGRSPRLCCSQNQILCFYLSAHNCLPTGRSFYK